MTKDSKAKQNYTGTTHATEALENLVKSFAIKHDIVFSA